MRSVRLPEAERGGFVMAFVVFMLFAVTIAATTGYLVVTAEFAMAKHSADRAESLTVARAGLERFIAEQIGIVGDSVTYALGNGVALVTSRKLFEQDSVTDMYYVRSEGTVADVFAPNSPARSVVGAYAIHRRRPLAHHSALVISADRITTLTGGTAHGIDYNVATDCPGGGASNITGAIATNLVTELFLSDIQGSPDSETWSGGYTEMLDSIGLRWDVLSDPDFPVDFDGIWPDFGLLPPDSFPVVRHSGFLYTNAVGRGVLIVDGTFLPGSSFSWDGIVLAGQVFIITFGQVRGLFIGGLDSSAPPTVFVGTDVHYYSCSVYAANESLSYLEMVDNTIFETN